MKKLLSASLLLVSAASAQNSPRPLPPLPRPAPEFKVIEPSGQATLLSNYRGNVVLLAFVLTTCPHCQALSIELEKMTGEFGVRGFRAVEVAFNEGGDVRAFVNKFGITFPVGQCSRAQVREFLQIPDSRIGTPQIVLIDRLGMIRAQSEPQGSPLLQSPDVLRALIASMLKRSAVQ